MEYKTLIGEIAKAHISYVDIANALGISRNTLNYKIHGKRRFTLEEVFAIKKKFFPNYPIEQLFSRESEWWVCQQSKLRNPYKAKQRKDKCYEQQIRQTPSGDQVLRKSRRRRPSSWAHRGIRLQTAAGS